MYSIQEPNQFKLYTSWMQINWFIAHGSKPDALIKEHAKMFHSQDERLEFLERIDSYLSKKNLQEIAKERLESAVRNMPRIV